jgi:dTDP-4-amino-4,6-dideoxygalactose transaminase
MIKYGRHFIDKTDIAEVNKALKSDFLTQGPFVDKFQKKILNFFGGKYCLVVSSGTAALHLAGLALGWKKNDIIIVSPLTFVASANCALYNRSKVEFSDIDKNTLTLDVFKLEKKIKLLKKK